MHFRQLPDSYPIFRVVFRFVNGTPGIRAGTPLFSSPLLKGWRTGTWISSRSSFAYAIPFSRISWTA